ncbi:MAG TPA: phosphoribosyltransferase family protein [Ferruginibacter sp.]|nr:phosphoribosyltransferase family protein [Ferruginibacter sp.]
MYGLIKYFRNTLHLFYPHICTGCGSDLLSQHEMLCLNCLDNLPHTGFENMTGNAAEKLFEGRVPIRSAHSQFYFAKHKLIQHLLHQLKYKGNREIGIYLGNMMGQALLKSNRFANPDALIPLPLHADKEFKRGYNQSLLICKGMAKAMQVPVITTAVKRERITETQTKKHRMERWQNVEDSFVLQDTTEIKNKHLLLVDDVVTTGATLEACSSALLRLPGVSISIATLAIANK